MKRNIFLLLFCTLCIIGCQNEDITTSSAFTIDTENSSVVGSFVQGNPLNNLSRVVIPYVNGVGGKTTISSDTINGMYIPAIDVTLEKGAGKVEVPIVGTPIMLTVTYLSVKFMYNGEHYITSVSIPVAEDPDPTGTINFTIDSKPIINLNQATIIPFTVSPTMAAIVVTSTNMQGLSVTVQSNPYTGFGTVTLTPSARFLGDTLKLSATFGARPIMKAAIPVSYFSSGTGSQLLPYIVKDEVGLAKLQYGGSKYFQLANNITCSSWSPMTSFSGNLDGNSKTVNYSVNTPAADSVAFIKRILPGATVKNLVLTGSLHGMNRVAGLAVNSAISPANCDASGVSVNGSNYLASLVFEGVGKDANVLTVGKLPTSINIMGGTQSASVALNVSPVNVSFKVVQNPTGATLSYDSGTGNLTAKLPADINTFTAGDVTYVVSLAASGAGSNVVSTTQTVSILSKKMYQSGTGVASDPYIVIDGDQLSLTSATYPNAFIKLGNNISLTQNWTPLPIFGGDLNGGGHTISNLTISGYTADATNGNGFVNVNNGTIHDIVFSGAQSSPTNKFGMVAGTNNGTLKNISLSGTITSTSAVDVLGGLVGELKTSTGLITNCYSNVSITAVCGMVGGIAGRSSGGTNIINCTSKGTITISAVKIRVGGILGRSEGSTQDMIKGCLSQMVITGATGANNFGGIFGANNNNTLKIEECQFSGSVKGDNDIGGIAGTGINVKNCLVDGAVLQNNAAPTNGSVGGICSTNKNYELNCIVRNTTITGAVGTTTKSAAGIGSFYQSGTTMGYASNCVVINTTITAAVPNRISGPAVAGGSLLNNYASNVIIQTSSSTPVTPVPDANGQDGANAPGTMDQAWYTSLGYDFNLVWNWNAQNNQPTLKSLGCSGIPTP